jgi:hypothetical protein
MIVQLELLPMKLVQFQAWQLRYTGELLGGYVGAAAMYSYEQNYFLTSGTTAANASTH